MNIWILVSAAIVCLVVLISRFKIHGFPAFLIVAIGLGHAAGLGTAQTMSAIQKGMGGTLGSIVAIIVIGAMIGKMISKSRATAVLSEVLVSALGNRRLPFAFMLIGFLVGMPLFFGVAFMLLVPLALSTAQKAQISALSVGIPLLAALSVTQGYLPPHPAPYYLVNHLPGADMGITLGLGIVIAIPAMLISGLWFGKTLKNIPSHPLRFSEPEESGNKPGFGISLTVLLLPVLLIAMQSFLQNQLRPWPWASGLVAFAGEPVIALLISLASAVYFLGLKRGVSQDQIQAWLLEAMKEMAPLLLIFAGAGAFKEVLQELKLGEHILKLSQGSHWNPLFIGWLIAALLRIVTGSSTVSGIMTAGLILPLIDAVPVNPNLMALSIGAGSMVLSHVNDSGFWLYKEYFGVSFRDTLRSWTLMETLIAVTGFLGVWVLDYFL